jgi:hypothetical protein
LTRWKDNEHQLNDKTESIKHTKPSSGSTHFIFLPSHFCSMHQSAAIYHHRHPVQTLTLFLSILCWGIMPLLIMAILSGSKRFQ